MEDRETTSKDFSWVTNGLCRLFRSRRILSYSYPFAYYMFGVELFPDELTMEEREIKKNLFEDQQQQLEANVEKLSLCLEEPFHTFEDEKVMETRMRIITMTTIVDNLCRKMWVQQQVLYYILLANTFPFCSVMLFVVCERTVLVINIFVLKCWLDIFAYVIVHFMQVRMH